MAITYPLDTPTDIGIAQIELRANKAATISRSPFTYKTQVHSYPGQIWGANISIPPVRRVFAEPWVSFLLSLRGRLGTFLLGDPLGANPRGTISGDTVLVNNAGITGANQAGDRSIFVDGLTPGTTGLLLPGDYIQLGSSSGATLHKVLTSVDSDASGEAEIDIWPAIRRDLNDNESVTYTDAKGLFRLAANLREWEINDIINYGISFECIEVI